jgi:lysophospholipase L1-like esterase
MRRITASVAGSYDQGHIGARINGSEGAGDEAIQVERYRWLASGGLGLSMLVALLLAPPADAAVSYVALGDSYASGVGTRTYYSDSGSCQRSPYAYPVVDAARIGATLSFRACSGATTTSVLNNQLGTLTATTAYVTLTVGGNDAGFASVVSQCAQPWWAANCNGAIDNAQTYIKTTLPGRLNTLYSAVRSKAPNAKIVIVGYPKIFMGEDCNAGTWFSPAEMTRLNATADLLDATIKGRATAYGFSFVDPRTSNPVTESYHPNRSGQTGYANLVDNFLT